MVGARVAVAELGDGHGVDGGDELGKGAGLLGDGDGQEGLLVLANGGALGDEAQPVKVHVGAAGDGDEAAVAVGRWVSADPLLESSERERTGRLDNGARVLEHVFNGRARLVGGDLDDLVDDLLTYPERLLADGLDGGPVCKQAHVAEHDALAGLERLDHGVGVVLLDADDLDVRRDALDVDARAGDQAAAAHATKDGREVLQVRLPQQLHADGALARNHIRVVEGRDGDQVVQRLQARGLCLGRVEIRAVQDHGPAHARDVLVLDVGGARGHDDGRGNLQLAGRVGDALGVVAGAARDDAPPAVLCVEMGHLVVGAAQLEAEDGLQVLALEQHIALEAVAEVGRVRERRLLHDLVHLGGQDQAQVVGVAAGQQERPGHDAGRTRARRRGGRAGVGRVLGQREAGVARRARRHMTVREAVGVGVGRGGPRVVVNGGHGADAQRWGNVD